MAAAQIAKCERIFSSVLQKIRPGASESRECFLEANRLISKLESVVPAAVEIKLAGSLAKGTNLSGNNEFDIFLLFPRHYPHHEMVVLGMHYARRAFRGMRTESRYAEHPYLQVFSGKYHADIVPAYKIERIEDKGSSVDRSQLHTEYVNSRLDSHGKNDVRLLKRFMKNFGIYGAELRVEGFSGYLCELLIIHYGSLLKLMEAASHWHEPVIDTSNHHNGETEKMKKKFTGASLILVDPTDQNRNVAAVVSRTSLSRFIFECRRFLSSPSDKFFFSKRKSRSAADVLRAIRERKTKCLLLSFKAPPVVPDVLWPQLKKTAQSIVKRMEDMDFSIFGSYTWSDGEECAILFELDCWELPSVRKAIGPSVKFARDVDAFVKKHVNSMNLHIEHDRVVAVERRSATNAKSALAVCIKSEMGSGIPAMMGNALRKKFVLMEGKAIAKAKYAEFLSDYFFMRIA
jgi:tRNA nucleotidyltransferase (CCA-adding enzyme)